MERIQDVISRITKPDAEAIRQAKARFDSIGKPLGSLGKLEETLIRIAGIQGSSQIRLSPRRLVILCADNGIVAEGVSQCGQAVTAVVAENFLKGEACTAIMCGETGTRIHPVDIGMAVDTPHVEKRKIAYGTRDFLKEPAMTREQAEEAVLTGIRLAEECHASGDRLLLLGEMGIGNTTTSSAVTAVLLGLDPAQVTGRGAGLSTAGLKHKTEVIRQGIALHHPDADDPLDVISKVGGFDIAGLTGLILGGAAVGMPVILDGFITLAAALAAVRLAPAAASCLIASHVSEEPGAGLLLQALHMDAMLTCGMHLGEGSGAVAILPLLDMTGQIYERMSTFQDMKIDAYVPLD